MPIVGLARHSVAVAVVLCLGLWLAAPAGAATITGVDLLRNHRVSRLVLQADNPLEYQVELADPQTVILRLAGARLAAALPSVAGDPLVAGLSARRGAGALELVIRTTAPGVTVLPLYDAAARRLTLELGGAPAVEEAVPASPGGKTEAPAKPPPAPPASKAPSAASPARPVPPAEGKPAAPPKVRTTASPASASPRKAASTPRGPVPAVLRVRLGTHREFTRLVLDGDAPLTGRLEGEGRRVVLRLLRGELLPRAPLPRPDRRVRRLVVKRRRPLVLVLELARPLADRRLFTLGGGNKLVLDLILAPPQKRAAAAEPAPERTPVVKPAKLEVSPQLPVPEPDQMSPEAVPDGGAPSPAPAEAASAAAAKAPVPAAPAARGSPVPADKAPVPSPAARARRLRAPVPPAMSPPPPELVLASPARVVDPAAGIVAGRMPPVPPPSALARPRGPMEMPAQTGPPASQAEVLAKVRRAAEHEAAEHEAAVPTPVPVVRQRPPQGARLGKLGREDAAARALFERAKRDLDTRRYASALVGFQEFRRKYPHHPLAAEATYRLADAFFYLHEKEIPRYYDQAMENYQRAIDLYPDSDQVPWALLMMGRIAMLAEETFKALGYFQIVIEDYPKSEYVPLAMVYRGQAFIAEGKWTAALNEFRAVAERYPDSRFRKDADWGQAQALFGLGRYERAALLLKDMDRRWPKLRLEEPELLYYIGEAEFQLKRYQEARRYFLWALNIMPDIRDNDIILTRVGDTYKFEGALAAARFIYKQVVNMFPDSDGGLVARIRLAESPQKDTQHPWDIFQVKATLDAFKTYREIIDKFPDRPVAELAQLKLGVYYYKKKQYTRALAILEKLLQVHPRTPFKPEVRYTLDLAVKGLLHQLKEQNRPLALMDAYLRNRGLLRRPNGNEVLALLAWAYEKTGLDARAAKLYLVLLGRGEEKPAYIIGLARNLMLGRKYVQIVEELTPRRLALLKGAEAAEARSILGRALAHLGRCERALKLLRPLVKMNPAPPHAARDHLWLGRCLIRKGMLKEGLAALDRAVAGMGAKEVVLKYVVTMEAAGVARQAGMYQRAADYNQKAEALAQDKEQRAQALYQLAQTLRHLKRHALVAAAFQRLAKLKVSPWSDMAQRHLTDMALAPRLAGVGGFAATPP